jgi:hypothetical protein
MLHMVTVTERYIPQVSRCGLTGAGLARQFTNTVTKGAGIIRPVRITSQFGVAHPVIHLHYVANIVKLVASPARTLQMTWSATGARLP